RQPIGDRLIALDQRIEGVQIAALAPRDERVLQVVVFVVVGRVVRHSASGFPAICVRAPIVARSVAQRKPWSKEQRSIRSSCHRATGSITPSMRAKKAALAARAARWQRSW